MSSLLTRKQRAIYDFIADCVHRKGIPPSLVEIADAFDLTSASGVADHLRALERKGFIRRRRGVSRGIELLDASRRRTGSGAVEVPVVGTLPARRRLSPNGGGRRRLMFDGRLAQRGAFAVRVNLQGLEKHGILRGDYLIVVKGAEPRPGELALAQLGRHTALVEALSKRRLRRVDDEAVVEGGVELLGRVVAVLRSMSETTRNN